MVQIKLGSSSAGGALQVLSGLMPGEKVVTSGQFLLDSESHMKEAIQKYLEAGLLARAQGKKAPSGAPGPAEEEASPSTPAEGSAAPGTRPAGAAPAGEKLPWSPGVDAVYLRYLEISRKLGAAQESDQPLELGNLVEAARGLTGSAAGAGQLLPRRVLEAAAAMEGKQLAEQRKLFKPLSDAVIALAEAVPPSRAVGAELYVAHCPMALKTGADWLQASKAIANPYFPSEMKDCGQITQTIRTVPGSK